eukprot:2998922-Rhodomonas_salina.1
MGRAGVSGRMLSGRVADSFVTVSESKRASSTLRASPLKGAKRAVVRDTPLVTVAGSGLLRFGRGRRRRAGLRAVLVFQPCCVLPASSLSPT